MTLDQLNTKLDELRKQFTDTAKLEWVAADRQDVSGWIVEGREKRCGEVFTEKHSKTRDAARALAKDLNERPNAISKTDANTFLYELLSGQYAITVHPAAGIKELGLKP